MSLSFHKIAIGSLLLFTNILVSSDLYASKPYIPRSASFGYIYNSTEDSNLNYLEIILPNAIASSLKRKFNFKTVNPTVLSRDLRKSSLLLKKRYNDIELPKFSESLDTGYFIYGDFSTLGDDIVQVKINVYDAKTLKIFTFNETGEIQAEIFKLVDRITLRLKEIMSSKKLYISEKIKPRATVGIITNLDGNNLNELYFEFLREHFSIKTFQANNLRNNITGLYIQNFYQMYSDKASFRRIAPKEDIHNFYTVWTDNETMDKVLKLKRMYEKYASQFREKQDKLLDSIRENYSSRIDYLLVIGFTEGNSSAWARCLNLKNKRLVYTQSKITSDSIGGIAQKIIRRLKQGGPI